MTSATSSAEVPWKCRCGGGPDRHRRPAGRWPRPSAGRDQLLTRATSGSSRAAFKCSSHSTRRRPHATATALAASTETFSDRAATGYGIDDLEVAAQPSVGRKTDSMGGARHSPVKARTSVARRAALRAMNMREPGDLQDRVTPAEALGHGTCGLQPRHLASHAARRFWARPPRSRCAEHLHRQRSCHTSLNRS
jgi:hypothetical protein